MRLNLRNFAIEVRDGPAQTGDRAIASEQFDHDIYQLAILESLIQPKTILDVGGHIGCFGMRAKATWPEARLIAYEPNQESFELYRRNVSKAIIHLAAVSYEGDKSCLSENPEWAGGGVLIRSGGIGKEVPAHYRVADPHVQIWTLEDAVAGIAMGGARIDKIDLLKLDCERAEVEILRQMKPETAAKIGCIVGEYHVAGGYNAWEKLVLSRFQEWKVMPLGDPRPEIGNFLAGPADLIDQVQERLGGDRLSVVTKLDNRITLSFFDGATVCIDGSNDAEYRVRFTDTETQVNEYTTTIKPGQWCAANDKFYRPWFVSVEENGRVVYQHRMNLCGKKVWISLSSKSLGDTVAWAPYAEQFRQKHECDVVVETFWRSILEGAYPNLTFCDANTFTGESYVGYRIGCYDNDYHRNHNHWRTIPVQQIAADILGLPRVDPLPTAVVRGQAGRPMLSEYVVLAEHSTFKGKEWLYPDGWYQVADWLIKHGYRVATVSLEQRDPFRDKRPVPDYPDGVVRWNDKPIQETIRNIQHAELLVSVSNGPMWLAHALGIPNVVISGFTLPASEPPNPFRVINTNVCIGCYSDPTHPFDRGNWEYCPRQKNFECSRSIRPTMVIEKIAAALNITRAAVPGVEGITAPTACRHVERVLFVTPHLSTGGLPQYLLQQVEKRLAAGDQVEVFEWVCLSGDYVIQRKKILNLCKVTGSTSELLFDAIRRFNPTVVHLAEFAELFLPDYLAEQLFRKGRAYQLVETSHSSGFRSGDKRWFPDQIEAVCRFHEIRFADLGVPVSCVPYTVEKKSRPNRAEVFDKLGLLQRDGKHILNIGLWTPNKNQGQAIEIARALPNYQFHFVGNQAPNFSQYWQPLMKQLPKNVHVWGERDDVDLFYSSMDALLFTSLSELAPIVVKEALAWGMPVLMRDLPIYLGEYDRESLVAYIDDNVERAATLLQNHLRAHPVGRV